MRKELTDEEIRAFWSLAPGSAFTADMERIANDCHASDPLRSRKGRRDFASMNSNANFNMPLPPAPPRGPIVCMTEFKGRLYLATTTTVYSLNGDVWCPIEFAQVPA